MFAEGIRSNELTFRNEINKCSEKYITRRCEEPTSDITKKTSGKRKNVEKLVLYLKERKTEELSSYTLDVCCASFCLRALFARYIVRALRFFETYMFSLCLLP